MIQLSDFIFEARESKKYSPEMLNIMAEVENIRKGTLNSKCHYGSVNMIPKELYDRIITNYNEISPDERKKNRWINIATWEGDPVISVAQTEDVYRKPIDRDIYYNKTTSAIEKKLAKADNKLFAWNNKIVPDEKIRDISYYLPAYIFANFKFVKSNKSGNWQYLLANPADLGISSSSTDDFFAYIAFSKDKKEWKLVYLKDEGIKSNEDYKIVKELLTKIFGNTSTTVVPKPASTTVTKPVTTVVPKPVATVVKPEPVKAATTAKTPVRKTPKYYQGILNDALKSNNIIDLKKALKEIIEKFGVQSKSYKDEIWLRVDSETLGDFWNSYPEAFIYNTKLKNIFVSIYWQGDSTDGNKEISLDDLWRNDRYVFRVSRSRGNGDYDDDRIYVEKKDIIEILKNIANNWLSSKEIKKRKEIADIKARIAPLAAAVDDLLGNELFRKHGGMGGSQIPSTHQNGKAAVKEWFEKNKELLAKKGITTDKVKELARKIYYKNNKPTSYFYEVNRYGWKGKKLRDFDLEIDF